MKRLACGLPILFCLLALVTADLGAQITIYRDSAEFDDDFARLRDVDFEGLYSMTLDYVTYRSPGSLWVYAVDDEQGEDTDNLYLSLSQGSTIEFPTRTRSVELLGYGNEFYVEVTNFNDSTYLTPMQTFPNVTITDPSGIASLRFWGTYGGVQTSWEDLDINWGAGLMNIALFDAAGDTITATDFDELPGERFWFMNRPYDLNSWAENDSLFMPTDIGGVTVHEPYLGILAYFFYEPMAKVDPDNPIGNLAIGMTDDATLDFPEGTEGVLVAVDGVMEGDSVRFEILDYAGLRDTVEFSWRELEFDTTWINGTASTFVGAASADGIRRITLLQAMTLVFSDWKDTIIDGDTVEIEVYEYVPVEIYVSALHLAETPPTEIAAIREEVEELQRPGYLASEHGQALSALLEVAEGLASEGDRSGAVGRLNDFRETLQTYLQDQVLAPEEQRILDGEAEYVISRLQGPSSVHFSSRQGDEFAITRVMKSKKGLLVDYSGLTADRNGELLLIDMAGRTVLRESLRLQSGEGSAGCESEEIEGSGAYLLVLRTSDGMSVRKVELR